MICFNGGRWALQSISLHFSSFLRRSTIPDKTRIPSLLQHALWAVFHYLLGPISLMETSASTAVLWNERTFHWYATTGKKVKWNVSSAIINAHKNTPLGMCSKYCSGEIISDKFFQWTCRSSASQFMFSNIPNENAEGWQLVHNNAFA